VISRTQLGIVVSLLAGGIVAGCSESSPSAPTAVTTAVPPTSPTTNDGLMAFTELSTGFSTSDLRDIDEQILQVTSGGELVWTVDGTRLSGYHVNRHVIDGVPIYWIGGGAVCREGCSFEVRFGVKDGERRAYVTADYGHDNPGTLVDVEVSHGALVVKRTEVFPPGTPSLSGVVFEERPGGNRPVSGVWVLLGISSGWRSARTDADGFYSIPGLFDFHGGVRVSRDEYHQQDIRVSINGATRLDVNLVKR
jgi:hypothetical protein